MKLLLDENLPVKLKYRFKDAGIEVSTVKDMNWFGISNGELLRLLLSESFTTLITTDNNLKFQQNFINYPIQVIVIVAPDNTYATIMEIFPQIIEKLKLNFIGVQTLNYPDFIK